MIVTKIRLQEEHPMTDDTTIWPLPFVDLHLDHHAGEGGYLLKAAQGLGPPEFTAVVDGFDQYGTSVMDSLAANREIVLRIGLNPVLGTSYSSLRDDIYKFISRQVLITLMDKSLSIAQTCGYIKRLETVHFSSLPEVQVTLECTDGMFSAPFSVDVPLSTLDTLTPNINYEEGTAPAGMEIQFTVTAAEDTFQIANHSKFWYSGADDVSNIFQVVYNPGFVADDVITITTHPKNRRVTLFRDPDTIDLAGYLNAGAIWPRLYPGVNAFTWDLANTWMTLEYVRYIPRWWGV